MNRFRYCIWCLVCLVHVGVDTAAIHRVATAEEPTDVDPAVLEAQTHRIEVMRRAATATVSIFGLDGGGGGSGVLISPDGFALTNYHVSSACGDHMRCSLNDGKIYDAVIVGVDAVGDVSLIQLLGRDDFPTAPMGDSSLVRAGQWCFAAGNPFVLASNRQPSVSLGIVSGVHRYQFPAGTLLEYADCLQTDAAINPGNSGGPLFNMQGELIGINGRCSFEKRGRINVGVGYAISINQIRTFLSALKSGRLLDHATLGATLATDDSGKVLVSNILTSSDAYRRGLRYGDEVIRFADRDVDSPNAFKNILGTLPMDLRVPIEIRREGNNETLLVRLAGVHPKEKLIELVSMGLGGVGPKENEKEEENKEEEKPDENQTQASPEYGAPNFELVQSMFQKRPGFSNYYYNQKKRKEIGEQLKALGDFASATEWKLSGHLAGESTQVEMRMEGEHQIVTVGSRTTDYQGDISDWVGERRQGGLAAALRAFRDLLRQGTQTMGEAVYLGTLPVYQGKSTLLSDQTWHECLEFVWLDARVRFYWDADHQSMSLIEVYGDPGTDPAEVYLDDYRPVAAGDSQVQFPHRLRLQYGTEIMLLVELDAVELSSVKSAEGVK